MYAFGNNGKIISESDDKYHDDRNYERLYMKNRLTNYDIMRVIACIFVILIHIEEKPFSFNVRILYTTVFFVSNGIFFMLSGKFNLEKSYDSINDYRNYYRKKFISILFPYLLVSVLLSVFNLYHESGTLSFKSVCVYAFQELFDKNSGKALWFMYPLIGFLISAPFLSKMFHALSDRECLLMVKIAMLWNVVKVYLVTPMGIKFGFNGWLLETWLLYFVAGYLCERLINDRNRKIVYLFGAAGFIVTVVLRIYTNNKFQNVLDYSPAYFLLVITFYDLCRNRVNIKNHVFQSLISFLAQHTYYIYLFHVHAMRYIVPHIAQCDTKTVPGYLLETALIFICSLICAVVLRSLIIKPLQSLLKKMPGLRVVNQE